MPYAQVNWLAVVVSSVVYMAIGFVWYHPALFGRKWAELSGKDAEALKKEMKEKALKIHGTSFAMSIILFYVLACAIDYSGAFTVLEGLGTAFWLWLGFVFTARVSGLLYEGKPFGLFLINAGYELVTMLAGGAILAIWI